MLLEVRSLTKCFRDKIAVDGVSFLLDAGDRLGIVGRSGCGKSTLVKLITRLIDSDGGSIVFDGEDITHSTELRAVYRKMQMIFQSPEDSFNPRKTLGWSIGEPLRNQSATNVEARVAELLREVDLPSEMAARYPHEVSGGQCQRAAIARAIALEPKMLICDEATSALDPETQLQVIELLRRLSVEKGLAVLFITHDLGILPSIAERVIVMHGGRIVESGRVEEVINAPRSEYTRELLAANFSLREVG